MKNLIKISTLSLAILSGSVLAQQEHGPHIVGLQIDFSAIDSKNNERTKGFYDIDTAGAKYSYQYELNPYFAVGIGYLKGNSEEFTFFISDKSNLKYRASVASARVQYPITKRSNVFAQVSGLKYDYDIEKKGKKLNSADGSDYGFSLGWKYQFDSGIGLKTGYEVLHMGKDISLKGYIFEVSYRF